MCLFLTIHNENVMCDWPRAQMPQSTSAAGQLPSPWLYGPNMEEEEEYLLVNEGVFP